MSTHNIGFSWRIDENYLSVVIKYHQISTLSVLRIISRGHDRGYINDYAIFTSDSRFDRTNGPCSKAGA